MDLGSSNGRLISGAYWIGRGPIVAPGREHPEVREVDLTPVGAFGRWLKRAKPGDRYTYFEGASLQRARELDKTIDLVAATVRTAYEKGFVHLVQERKGSVFRYMVQRKEK